MPFKDWAEIAKNDLVLPILGESYTIPPLGFLDELRIRESQQASLDWIDARDAAVKAGEEPPAAPDGIGDEEFLTMLLGGVLAQMRANNVPSVAILHAARVAHANALHGRDAAEALWEKGMDPEALAAEMAAFSKTLSTNSKGSTPSRSTGSASGTRSRASSSATTSRRATPPRKAAAAAKAPRSPGTQS